MKKIIIISALFFIAISGITAQDIAFKASNFKDDKEGFKTASENLKKGDECFELALEKVLDVTYNEFSFVECLELYQEVQKFNPNNAALNLKIGICHYFSYFKDKSIPYFDKAYQLDKTAETDDRIILFKGASEHLKGNYDEATKHFKAYKTAKSYEIWKKWASIWLKSCKYAADFTSTPTRAWVDNVEVLNSAYHDYSPCLSADGSSLMYTSRRENGKALQPHGQYDSDIYYSENNGTWSVPKNVGSPLSTDADDGTGGFSYDGQKILVHKMIGDNTEVLESTLNGLTWSEPKVKMPNLPNRNGNDGFACYEPLDIKIHYITNSGAGGGNNIFFSGLIRTSGKEVIDWGKGQSISHQVNTPFHDNSVYIHPDGNTVYFSSQGHNSMGGFDVYKSTFENGQWSPPVNMGFPINSPYDDLFFAATASGKYAYISSNRPEGKGGLDIYKITFWGPEKKPSIDHEDFLLASYAMPSVEETLAKVQVEEKKSLTVFKGHILDHITKDPLGAEIEIIDNDKNQVVNKLNSNSATGKFLLSLPAGINYGIAVKKDGYLFHSENFDLPKGDNFNMVNKDVFLKNISIGSKIALRNVFFATGKSDITANSYPELDRLIQLMTDLPSLKIELSGHTDNTGSEAVNQKLSQDRAQAVKDYLAGKGISSSRLTAKGYGSTKPVETNNTSDGRASNRRTEFEIIAN